MKKTLLLLLTMSLHEVKSLDASRSARSFPRLLNQIRYLFTAPQAVHGKITEPSEREVNNQAFKESIYNRYLALNKSEQPSYKTISALSEEYSRPQETIKRIIKNAKADELTRMHAYPYRDNAKSEAELARRLSKMDAYKDAVDKSRKFTKYEIPANPLEVLPILFKWKKQNDSDKLFLAKIDPTSVIYEKTRKIIDDNEAERSKKNNYFEHFLRSHKLNSYFSCFNNTNADIRYDQIKGNKELSQILSLWKKENEDLKAWYTKTIGSEDDFNYIYAKKTYEFYDKEISELENTVRNGYR